MRAVQGNERELRQAMSVRRGHSVAAKVMLLVALVLFVVFWLLLAPGTAAAAL